ncbi:prepilin peptidase [Patescibacteria group bacterium]|nr:prepilin peptidase [Patescibacteria group bacterium]
MTLVLFTILASLVGIAVGSFINVVVFRTRVGQPITGKSKCRKCLEPIATIDLIPIVSYFALKGRCRRCAAVIEWQYPVVELAMGILFGLFFVRTALGLGLPDWVGAEELFVFFLRDVIMASFLLIIFVYDFRYSYILDRFSIPAIIVALLFNVALGAPVFSLLVGGLVIGGFFAFQFLVSQGKWIGGGDIRMGMLMGFLLGIEQGLVALFLSYIFGAFVGIGLILAKKRKLDGTVPFGTFMAAGILVTLFAGEYLLDWYLGFFG